jgi:hypothetical protein
MYILLAISSLLVIGWQRPLAQVLEGTRLGGVGLMPGDCLMLRWLGTLFRAVPVVLTILFGLSWKLRSLNTATALAITSTVLFLTMCVYTSVCLMVLVIHL